MQITQQQCDELGAVMFIEKLCAEMARAVPAFAAVPRGPQREFARDAMREAGSRGVITEQGVASYVLAVWWLGAGFSAASTYLDRLLESPYPEVRKVYAMNEWVLIRLGQPHDPSAADARLRAAFYETQPWGKNSAAFAGATP